MLSHQCNCFSLLFIFVLSVISGCSSTLKTEKLSLNTSRFGHAVVNDTNKIYVLAGANANGLLSDIEIIDPVTSKTTVLKKHLIPRRFFSAVWDGEHSIYIMGGVSRKFNRTVYEDRVEIFDTITHKVSYGKPMPFASRFNTAVFIQGNIFALGGSSIKLKQPTARSTVGVYNITKNEWMRTTDMPTAKATKAIVKDDQIYVVGGYNEKEALNVFETFDIKTSKWESLPSIPEKISAHSVTISNNKLLVFGDYKKLRLTYSYDFDTAKWEKNELNYNASRHNAATSMNGNTYVIGGTTTGNQALDYIQKF
jgi:N-acetylneuraminic acid mutarotase